MNKFHIAEKYNEMGKTNPLGFVKWLITNMPQRFKAALKGFLEAVIEMLKKYDIAAEASKRKIHFPWDKKEEMVEPDYYEKEKEKIFENDMKTAFRTLGMGDAAYFDQAQIDKALVLEDYFKDVFDESCKKEGVAPDSEDYIEAKKAFKDIVDSIDLGKNSYSLTCIVAGQTQEYAVMTKKDLEQIMKDAGIEKASFLMTDKEFHKNGESFVIINAANEQFKDLMLDRAFGRTTSEKELNPEETKEELQPEGKEAAPDKASPTEEREGKEPKENREKATPEKKEKPKYMQFKRVDRVLSDTTSESKSVRLMNDLKPTFLRFRTGIAKEDINKTYIKVKAFPDKVHQGKLAASMIQIPYTDKDPSKAYYLKISDNDKINGQNRVSKDKDGYRYITMALTETFPVYDATGNPVVKPDGDTLFMTVEQLCTSHFLVMGKATGEEFVPPAPETPAVEIPEPPHQENFTEFKDGVLKLIGDPAIPVTKESIPEGAEITTIDFDHKAYKVEAGAINDMPQLSDLMNIENVTFADKAIVGCCYSQSDYMAKAALEEQQSYLIGVDKEPQREVEAPEEKAKPQQKEPTAYAKQQLFEGQGITR